MKKLSKKDFLNNCRSLLAAYKDGLLGDCTMPEETNPGFSSSQKEERLIYFTLPMSLNYQRSSYGLWRSALLTYQDETTKDVFSLERVKKLSERELTQ